MGALCDAACRRLARRLKPSAAALVPVPQGEATFHGDASPLTAKPACEATTLASTAAA